MNLLSVYPFSPTVELLGALARVDYTEVDGNRVDVLLSRIEDWDAFVASGRRHGMLPAAARGLAGLDSAIRLPQYVREELERSSRITALRNLAATARFLSVMDRLEEAGIRCAPIKGMALSHQVYEDPGVRPYRDVDVLLHRTDLGPAHRVLEEIGFETFEPGGWEKASERIPTQMGIEYTREDWNLVIELHWAFMHRIHAFHLRGEDVWTRMGRVRIGSGSVRMMDPVDTVLFLVAHGAKHLWKRLYWICDLDRCLRKWTDLDWKLLLERARETGSLRMLMLGLSLSHELFGTEVPGHLRRQMEREPHLEGLILDVGELLELRSERAPGQQAFWFISRTRERWRDLVPYWLHHARLSIGWG